MRRRRDYMRFAHHHPPPSWTHNRRFLLWRFAWVFGGLSLLFIIGIGIIGYLTIPHDGGHARGGAFLPLCAIPILFIILASVIGGISFRRYGTPIAEVMSAVDAIAEGDLSVRVPEGYPRELGRPARRFNHMIAELERAEKQRRNLTADVAHELRNPLHIIQGNLEGILDGVYQPTPEHITNTLDETRLLSRLVDDLQTLSLAEAGQLPLHPARIQLVDLFAELTSSFAAQASALGITLKTDLPDSTLALTADRDRLDQVLSNLIANALRHTPQAGTITLHAESIPDGRRLMVSDTGSGIPPEDLPFIFDRFWRGDRARQRAAGLHSGLGLAIAKQLVQAHGGTISVESKSEAGTKFTIELPE
jgi:two-component system sensor histidine kinase BaeS